MLLRSEISERLLADGARLIICSPNADEVYFREEFDHPQIELVKMPHSFSKLEMQMMNIRQYALMNPKLGQTLNHKQEALKTQNPKRYRISCLLNSVLGRVTPIRHLYMWAEGAIFPGTEFDPLLHQHQPNLVVTGTPGFNAYDAHLLRAAKRLRIPSVSVILSWDNLTSKGVMNGVPVHLIVWSDLMADDAMKYHDYPRERIQWCGAAQFDHYFNFRQHFDRSAWRTERGIPADAGLIVYGTINPPICPHEPQIVRSIIRQMREGQFPRTCHLWVRLHPQVVKGDSRHIIQPYLDMAAEDVHIEVPPVQSDALSWDLPKSDAIHLAKTIAAADIVVTTSSTLSIDAACLDTPIINIFYDGDTSVDAAVSTQRFKKYTHYARLLRTGGIAIADRPEQFAEFVRRYLNDPSADRAGREAMLRQELNEFDGLASARTASALQLLARHSRSAASNDRDLVLSKA